MTSTDFKTGDIILLEPSWWNIITKGISLVDKTPYSHAELFVKSWDAPTTIGSDLSGTDPKNILQSIGNRTICVLRPNIPIDIPKFSKIASSRIGIPYNFTGTFIDQLIYQMTGKWRGGIRTDDYNRLLYCTEFVAWVFNTYQPGTYPRPYEADPLDILNNPINNVIYKGLLLK